MKIKWRSYTIRNWRHRKLCNYFYGCCTQYTYHIHFLQLYIFSIIWVRNMDCVYFYLSVCEFSTFYQRINLQFFMWITTKFNTVVRIKLTFVCLLRLYCVYCDCMQITQIKLKPNMNFTFSLAWIFSRPFFSFSLK